MKQKQIISDSNVYIVARYIAFFIASVASGLFNIFLFSSLDHSYAYLLIALSVALEGAKLTTVISINVSRSLYLKLGHKPLKTKSNLLFGYYLIYGFLSILASLGFSIYITAKTQTLQNTELEILLGRRTAIESKVDEITQLRQSANIATYMEYPLWIEANEQYNDYNARYEEADLTDTQLRQARDLIADKESEEYLAAERNYQAGRTALAGFRSQMQRASQERLRIQNAFEASKEDMSGQIDILNNQLQALIEQAGIEDVTDGSTALIILNERIQNENLRVIQEKGMTYMFEGFSDLTAGKLTPNFIKIFILLLASLLLELTIYQCSPDIKISGWILKYFKRSLPEDKKFQDILALYDDENVDEIITEYEKAKQAEAPIIEVPMVAQMQATFKEPVKLEFEPVIEQPPIKPKKPRKKRTPKPKIVEVPVQLEPTHEPIIVEKTIEVPVVNNDKIEIEEEILPPTQVIEEVKLKESSSSTHYRFGRASDQVINKAIDFVNLCITGPGKFAVSPQQAAVKLGFSSKAKDVFLEHLALLKINKLQLIYKKDDEYYSNFGAKEIIDYMTEAVNE